MREVKVSPDGNSVAIRSDSAEESWNAYGIFNAINGGSWVGADTVEGWAALIPDPAPAP